MICTTIEQSKKLVELGIDVNTADMCWLYANGEYFYEVKDGALDDEDVYAWSLTALSNFILPYIMDDDGNNYKINISMDGLDRWVAYYKSDDFSIHICEESEDLIDVIFEMVCWLKEEGKHPICIIGVVLTLG